MKEPASPRTDALRWPLPDLPPTPPSGEGRFGAVRRYDVHTGIDLYCPERTPVVSLAAGVVVAVVPFTGPEADSPWWNPTQAVLVEDEAGVWLYGEVIPLVEPGASVSPGARVGLVTRVLRHDKGRPTTMLHLERYVLGTREPVWWRHGEPQPEILLDPSPLLFPTEKVPPFPV